MKFSKDRDVNKYLPRMVSSSDMSLVDFRTDADSESWRELSSASYASPVDPFVFAEQLVLRLQKLQDDVTRRGQRFYWPKKLAREGLTAIKISK